MEGIAPEFKRRMEGEIEMCGATELVGLAK
jgi:hypothetical protein